MKIIKEACVGNYREGMIARDKGANRIELCDNLMEGGTTPSHGTIYMAKESMDIDINVMIRPRGGDFVYNEDEIRIMEKDIELCKELGVNGVVFGVLKEDNSLDEKILKRLIEKAQGLEIVFHMAFNRLENKKEGIDKLVELGVDIILTSGGIGKAMDNYSVIKELVEYADNRITILAGGGVTSENYQELMKKTGVSQVHGTKIV